MTMSPEDCYAAWAPDDVEWARWAKPVLFTQLGDIREAEPSSLPAETPVEGLPDASGGVAVVVDLGGEESLLTGLKLATRGFRPVPLYNATSGPRPAVDVSLILRWLRPGAEFLTKAGLRPDAPPALLLDADRNRREPGPGDYDNRWVVLPQDFPSAAFLQSRKIREVVLVQRGTTTPREDLAHVLRRWQDGGVRILALDLMRGGAPEPIDVPRPSAFRVTWYGLIALLGLRRSNVGGFGGMIPEQTSGGGGFRGGFA
jgi:hypothetical protein